MLIQTDEEESDTIVANYDDYSAVGKTYVVI